MLQVFRQILTHTEGQTCRLFVVEYNFRLTKNNRTIHWSWTSPIFVRLLIAFLDVQVKIKFSKIKPANTHRMLSKQTTQELNNKLDKSIALEAHDTRWKGVNFSLKFKSLSSDLGVLNCAHDSTNFKQLAKSLKAKQSQHLSFQFELLMIETRLR